MTAPSNVQTFESEIATYWFEDGVLISFYKPQQRTTANVNGNIALIKLITNNKTVPLLIYLSNSFLPNLKNCQFAITQSPFIYSALGMVCKPGLSNIVINFLCKLSKASAPTKNFLQEDKAKQWLKQYL